MTDALQSPVRFIEVRLAIVVTDLQTQFLFRYLSQKVVIIERPRYCWFFYAHMSLQQQRVGETRRECRIRNSNKKQP